MVFHSLLVCGDNLHYEKFADGGVKCIEDEIPFELPDGWAWARFSTITINRDSERKPISSSQRTGVEKIYDYYGASGKIDKIDKYIFCERLLLIGEDGANLVTRSKPIAFFAEGLYWVNNHAHCIDSPDKLLLEYLCFYINAISLEKYVTGSAQPKMTQDNMNSILIPLPPYNEQKRLSQHLDEIMAMVDRIEIGKIESIELISKAKSKILDLAIRGQLVPQDPDDEPASVLLERIRAEKEELIKQGKLKRDKKESVIFRGEDNSYYLRSGELTESLEDWAFEGLPDSWSVCCLGELCDYGNCINVDTVDIAESAWMLDLEDIEKDSGVVLQKVRKAERNAASTKHWFHKGQVLYSKLRPYLNKVVLADEDGYCTSEILPLEFERNIIPQYARYYLMSPTFLRYANKCSYGVKMPRLGAADGTKAIIPVPPLEEQKRIVIAIEQTFSQLAFITENLS
jgi:type I restriction enzyme S subunit